MFDKSARFYDLIYGFKDYATDSIRLHGLIQQHKRTDGNTLLEVACGTGAYFPFLRENYKIEGLDLDAGMLAIARARFPEVPLHQADMADFDLSRQFDVVACLFSSIGYARTLPRLHQTIATLNRHLKSGGVMIIEPWLTPEFFKPGGVHARFVDEPDLKIARMNDSTIADGLSIMTFYYLVASPQGVEYFTEKHEMGLFTNEQYAEALRASGLEVLYEWPGLMNRGLYLGLKS